MAISYPLTPPAGIRIASLRFSAISAVARNISPFTFSSQSYNWTGTMISGDVECPPMNRADAEELIGFLIMAARGTFYFRDYANGTQRGNMSSNPQLDGAHAANTTTITIDGGSGSWAVGDYIQLGTGSSSKLHKITKVNGTLPTALSYEIFPLLRTAYPDNTDIVYSNAVGVFRLGTTTCDWSIDTAKKYGLNFSIFEAINT
jgi:hypothetical protein